MVNIGTLIPQHPLAMTREAGERGPKHPQESFLARRIAPLLFFRQRALEIIPGSIIPGSPTTCGLLVSTLRQEVKALEQRRSKAVVNWGHRLLCYTLPCGWRSVLLELRQLRLEWAAGSCQPCKGFGISVEQLLHGADMFF